MGDWNNRNAGIISICESWASFLERTYADRIYGADHSNDNAINTYNRILEIARNATQNHVPIGLHHDLVDDENILDAFICDRRPVICGTVIDNVRGFTIAQLFSSLTPQITTIPQYRDRLIQTHLNNTPNTVRQVNDLYNSY